VSVVINAFDLKTEAEEDAEKELTAEHLSALPTQLVALALAVNNFLPLPFCSSSRRQKPTVFRDGTSGRTLLISWSLVLLSYELTPREDSTPLLSRLL
jgi:hypothetical protein